MKKTTIAIAVTAALISPASMAFDLANGLSVKGFGTLGIVNSSSDQADYVAHFYFQPTGAGRSDRTSFKVDSKAGLQFDWQAAPRVSLTAQILSKQFEDKTWTPRLEWAFAKFNVAPNLDVRVGRIRPPIYMLSAFLDVNYANPWVRPPVEFYSSAPLTRMEGVDLLWRPTLGEISWLVQPYVGQSKVDASFQRQLDAKKILGMNVSASLGDFSARAGYIQTRLTAHNAVFDAGARQLLNTYCALAGPGSAECLQRNALLPDDRKSTFASIGASWDNGEHFVSGEYGKRQSDSFVADASTWYITGGARIGKWTPFATYSTFSNDSSTKFTGGAIPANAVFSGSPSTAQLITAILLSNPMKQNTATLGVRYDLMRNLALKLQWDHVKTEPNNGQPATGSGLFVNAAPGFGNQARHIDLISLSADFTF